MNEETLSLVAGAILSLLIEYFPGFRLWHERLSPEQKRWLMLGMITLVAVAIYFAYCHFSVSVPDLEVSCNASGIINLLRIVIMVAISNQTTHKLIKR
jgi:hypothetical protein